MMKTIQQQRIDARLLKQQQIIEAKQQRKQDEQDFIDKIVKESRAKLAEQAKHNQAVSNRPSRKGEIDKHGFECVDSWGV